MRLHGDILGIFQFIALLAKNPSIKQLILLESWLSSFHDLTLISGLLLLLVKVS